MNSSISSVLSASGQVRLLRGLLPAAHLSDDGRAAVLTLPLDLLPRISVSGVFAPRERYRVAGIDLAQRLDGSFNLQAAHRGLPGEADGTPPNQNWSLLTWTYQTKAPAIVWAAALAHFGAISVETLVFSPADNLWQLTGSLYASR